MSEPLRVCAVLPDGPPSMALTQYKLMLASADESAGLAFHTCVVPSRVSLPAQEAGARNNRHPGNEIADWRRLAIEIEAADPHVIHVIGEHQLRGVYLLRVLRLIRPRPLVVSGIGEVRTGAAGWLTRRALRSAACVLAYTARQTADLEARLPAKKLVRLTPGVAAPAEPADRLAIFQRLGLPPSARIIVCVGRCDEDFRTAIWAFDVVKYVDRDLYLVLIGDGPKQPELEAFGRALGVDDYRIVFAGYRTDVPAILSIATVAWATAARGGVCSILEAMAAGLPVLPMRTPDSEAVVRDGETGILIQAGKRVSLASQTAELLANPELAMRIGKAARAEVTTQFAHGHVADQTARVYHTCAKYL